MKHKERKESIAANLIKMKNVKKNYHNIVTEANKYDEMLTKEQDRVVQTNSLEDEPTHYAKESLDNLHKYNLKYKDSSNENVIPPKYTNFNDHDYILNSEFQSKQNETSTRRILFKKIDVDSTLVGKFSNRFKESLIKTKSRINIIPPELHLEETLSIWKMDKLNKNTLSLDSNYLHLPNLSGVKFSSPQNIETKNPISIPQSFLTKYNHSSHLKQKFLNHKKLFGNQHDIKKLYYAINNVHNDMINVKINFQNQELRSKGKDKKINKVIDYRKIFQQRLDEKKRKDKY
jgi:hypothetical protein